MYTGALWMPRPLPPPHTHTPVCWQSSPADEALHSSSREGGDAQPITGLFFPGRLLTLSQLSATPRPGPSIQQAPLRINIAAPLHIHKYKYIKRQCFIARAGRSVLGIGIPVFRYQKWKFSTNYLNTDLLTILPDTCYWKWSPQLSVVGIFKNVSTFFRLSMAFYGFFKAFFLVPISKYQLLTFWKFYWILDTGSWWEKIPATGYQTKFLVLCPALIIANIGNTIPLMHDRIHCFATQPIDVYISSNVNKILLCYFRGDNWRLKSHSLDKVMLEWRMKYSAR